jgi:hypothetical protein
VQLIAHHYTRQPDPPLSIRYFVQDESRFGLHTLPGRCITLSGVKPTGQWQWRFQAFWLYGAVEPLTGESFFWHFSHADSDCFQHFLHEFAQAFPDSLNIMQVDRGRLHTAKRLQIPDNIILLFQPPYCPELNPIERLWQHLKQDLRWQCFDTLQQLQDVLDQRLIQLTPPVVASLTGYDFILNALSSVVNIS